jgi:hypothetical protein
MTHFAVDDAACWLLTTEFTCRSRLQIDFFEAAIFGLDAEDQYEDDFDD